MSLLPMLGCAMCMGAPDGHTGQALNGAIFLMLGFIGSVLGLVSIVAVSLVRRSHRLGASAELHAFPNADHS